MFYDIVHVIYIKVKLTRSWRKYWEGMWGSFARVGMQFINVIILQHNEIKASFANILNLTSDVFNPSRYKIFIGYVSKYALELISQEFDRVHHIRFDSESCGCIIKQIYGLPCTYELTQYDLGVIPQYEIYITWIRLNFSNISSNVSQTELCI